MKKLLSFIFIINIINTSFSQDILLADIAKRVHLDSAICSYTFYVTDKQVTNVNGKQFYWYKAGRILVTMEGYEGRLLDGSFEKTYLNRNLCERGEFRNGMKTGLWRSWYETGILKEKSHWDKGIQKDTERFDSLGRTTEKGSYKETTFTGTRYGYSKDGKAKETSYNNGEMVNTVTDDKKNTQGNTKTP
ncbi:hypothetical protein F5148DRAFT_1293013 [Russula earlei]|uniref:Uncharacterized protein n=1 Tax=Russula earlei TaxID=71964 RepID=A0ACC0TSQ7_9AGAM|nr:hypothetical protein F5148DRAFT_1293013 [Russula earlei]